MYIYPSLVTIGVYLSIACHYQCIFVQCLSEIRKTIIIPYVFQWFGIHPWTCRICPQCRKWAICYSSGPHQHAPRVRRTWVLTNSLKLTSSNVRCAVDWEFVYIELVPRRRLGELLGALGEPLGVPKVARCSWDDLGVFRDGPHHQEHYDSLRVFQWFQYLD